MKKFTKIISTVLMVMILISVATTAFAAKMTGPGVLTGDDSTDTSGIQKLGNRIITILSSIGMVVSVVVLIALGIKYMIGSAEEKAEYKKTLLPYLIGAGLVFAASVIAQVVFNFMNGISAS